MPVSTLLALRDLDRTGNSQTVDQAGAPQINHVYLKIFQMELNPDQPAGGAPGKLQEQDISRNAPRLTFSDMANEYQRRDEIPDGDGPPLICCEEW